MARKKKQTLFVIFSGPQQHAAPGTRYIAQDGSTTGRRSQAATFVTFHDAKDFAEHHGIVLDAHTYIGQEDFTAFELGQG
jgi:hypothetical protein